MVDKSETINVALESHHAELRRLSQQIEELEQQKAVIKAQAIVGLAARAEAFGIPREAIGNVVAGCW